MTKTKAIRMAKQRAKQIGASTVVLVDCYGNHDYMDYSWWVHSTNSDTCACIIDSDGFVHYED